MNTLPSLHLFCDGSLQKQPYQDLDYLNALNDLQISSENTLPDPDVLPVPQRNGGSREQHANLTEVFDSLINLKSEGHAQIILFNSPTSQAETEYQILVFSRMLSQIDSIRTLVIDCNFRATKKHGLFDLLPGAGLADFISGNAGVDTIINESFLKNVFIVQSDGMENNPLRLLMSSKLSELIDVASNEFDYILVNSAPYREYIDAFALAKFLRPVVLLLPDKTKYHDENLSGLRAELSVLKVPIIELSKTKPI